MGLAITVGILADLSENDPEAGEEFSLDFSHINDVLRRHGLPEHSEPLALPPLDDRTGTMGFPYSFLHYLRRYYARFVGQQSQNAQRSYVRRFLSSLTTQPTQEIPPVMEGENPAHDPAIDQIGTPRHHLLWHSDCEGFYIPIDFPEVLEDDRIAGGGFGSSQRLLEELALIASPLGIMLQDRRLSDAQAAAIAQEREGGGPYWIERLVWLSLFEAARLSIEHRAAIHFG